MMIKIFSVFCRNALDVSAAADDITEKIEKWQKKNSVKIEDVETHTQSCIYSGGQIYFFITTTIKYIL
jgi:hypothetical protein